MPKLSNTRFNADIAFAAMQVKRMLYAQHTVLGGDKDEEKNIFSFINDYNFWCFC